jgi:alpha-1,3-rhamnosyl/mannosyltransferase
MITIGLESSSLCTPRRAGIQHYIISFVDCLLEDERCRSAYELRLLYKLSRYQKRRFRHLPLGARANWYYPGILPVSGRFGLIHSLDGQAVPSRKAKHIATVYDLAVFKERLQDNRYSPERFRKKKWDKVKALLDCSDAIMTLSANTKKDLLEHFDYPDHQIYVVPPGIDPAFLDHGPADGPPDEVLNRYGLKRDGYFLFVGEISHRKNIANLIHAYAQSGASESIDLVLAGRQSAALEEMLDGASTLNLRDRLKLLGHVPDEALPSLYSGSRAFLFPTYYEGFGIPILEAMACRTPVLIGNWGAAPEVANGHAVEVDPFEIDSIAHGISKILESKSPSVEEAASHAARHTWSACAERTVDLYETILNG